MQKLKHYLIASETNNYKPWITSSSALACFIVIVWGLRLILPASLTLAQGYLDVTDLMNRINQERSSRYIATLTTNDKLITAASGKASDMLARSYFSHIDPDGNYVWPRIEAAGYTPYVYLGENLAMDFTSPDDLMNAWMNSPTHRDNILNTNYQDQGLALSTGLFAPNHNTTIVVSLFGTLEKTSGSDKTNISPTPTPPAPTPTPTASSSNTKPTSGSVAISTNAKISLTQVSGHNIIDVAVPISGSPTLVTASLKDQSITLLPQSDGTYEGSFTFNMSDPINGQSVNVEARSASGQKVDASLALGNIVSDNPQTDANDNSNPTPTSIQIPISEQAQIINILRIIFGAMSVIYLGFLITDWIIIKRAKVPRAGAHLAPQIVVFLLIAFINLFIK